MQSTLGKRRKRLSGAELEVAFFNTASGILVIVFGFGLIVFSIVVFSINQFALMVMLTAIMVFTLFIILALSLCILATYLVFRCIVRPFTVLLHEMRGGYVESNVEMDEEDVESGYRALTSGDDDGVTLVIDDASDMPMDAIEEPEQTTVAEYEVSKYIEPVRAMVSDGSSKTEVIAALWGVQSGRKYQEASRIFDECMRR